MWFAGGPEYGPAGSILRGAKPGATSGALHRRRGDRVTGQAFNNPDSCKLHIPHCTEISQPMSQLGQFLRPTFSNAAAEVASTPDAKARNRSVAFWIT
jgi:hypothetical protein